MLTLKKKKKLLTEKKESFKLKIKSKIKEKFGLYWVYVVAVSHLIIKSTFLVILTIYFFRAL